MFGSVIVIMGKSKRSAIAGALLACALIVMCTSCGSKEPAAENVADTEQAGTVSQTESVADAEAQNSEDSEDAGESEESRTELPDGVYTADFNTDSSMFHVSEACDGKGTLTVEDGKMTIHISLGSKNIVNLYPGLAADAQKEDAETLEPTVDTVTYSDGFTEEVNGFDVPVPALAQEFDLALLGKKGKWYDHKVIVSNPVAQGSVAGTSDGSATQTEGAAGSSASASAEATLPENGVYTVEITFEGGSGKAKILSPVTVTIEDKTATASLQWDSPNYDYMIVDGQKYLPVNSEGDSVFEVPVTAFDEPIAVIGDTVAMSKPHEVEYTLTFHSDTMKAVE